ncbi:MAG: hypothetical protein A2Y94_08320 [Caldithrix sp. RBG_13_44_9]|nr:MAG: hypothetical protein A2Y94_08320 [Caldithrix sp. RBG_13_44_9]
MKVLWKRIPEQLRRLSILVLLLIVLFVMIRTLLVPRDFGKYGHYRASAVDEIVSQSIHYAGREACEECHDDIAGVKSSGFHRNVACEVCHGPGAAHMEDPSGVQLTAPRERGYCPLCHEYLTSRPTGFPQIVSDLHNPMKPCIACHEPHDPKPPVTPKGCEACHAAIARTLSLSHHVYLPCTRCHQDPGSHKISPREFTPTKPTTREFCGECHARNDENTKGIPQIELVNHYSRYVCWQCHYPHLPEAQ